jgi:hypothetical protein
LCFKCVHRRCLYTLLFPGSAHLISPRPFRREELFSHLYKVSREAL